jgi:hypothetical protein
MCIQKKKDRARKCTIWMMRAQKRIQNKQDMAQMCIQKNQGRAHMCIILVMRAQMRT